MEPKLLSITAAANALGIGRSKTYQIIAAGDLDTVMLGRRRLVTVASIDRLVKRLQEKA